MLPAFAATSSTDLGRRFLGALALASVMQHLANGTGGMGHTEMLVNAPDLPSYQRTEHRRLLDGLPRRYR